MAHGGRRNGSGRKSKAEELELPKLIDEVIGEKGKAKLLKKIYQLAETGSFPHQQLLMHYIYGKPTDKVDMTTKGNAINEVKHTVTLKKYNGGKGN